MTQASASIFSLQPSCLSASRWHVPGDLLQDLGIPCSSAGIEVGYVVKDAKKWEVEPEKTASEFDIGYYGKLLEKAWGEVAYVFESRDQ